MDNNLNIFHKARMKSVSTIKDDIVEMHTASLDLNIIQCIHVLDIPFYPIGMYSYCVFIN